MMIKTSSIHRESLARLLAAMALVAMTFTGAAHAEPDEVLLGKDANYPVGGARNWSQNPYRVGSWSAMDQVPGQKVRPVAKAAQAQALPPFANPPTFRYSFEGRSYTLADYLERRRATGLLILKNGQVVAEHYRYGRKDDARFLSFSMAKSVTAMLIGTAIGRGLLKLDDKAEVHVPALAGSAYGATTVQQLLRMSSGLRFTEHYDGNDDIARLTRAFNGRPGAGSVVDVLRSIEVRHSPPGEKFVYASAETEVLGRVLAAATGRNLADLTRDWLWQPMGAEHEAFWLVGADGQEQAYGGFNASLRDWGRLGLLLAQGGRHNIDGQPVQLVPADYLLDATSADRQPAAFRPRAATPVFGYGYQFWLLPGNTGAYTLQGVHGQTIYVMPSANLVLVHTAAYEAASGMGGGEALKPYLELGELWRAVVQSLGNTR